MLLMVYVKSQLLGMEINQLHALAFFDLRDDVVYMGRRVDGQGNVLPPL